MDDEIIETQSPVTDLESKAMQMEIITGSLLVLDDITSAEMIPHKVEQLCATFSIDRHPDLFCCAVEHVHKRRPLRRQLYEFFVVQFLTRKNPDRRAILIEALSKSRVKEIVSIVRSTFMESQDALIPCERPKCPENCRLASMRNNWVGAIQRHCLEDFQKSISELEVYPQETYFIEDAIPELQCVSPFQLAVCFKATNIVTFLKRGLGVEEEHLTYDFIKFSVIGNHVQDICNAIDRDQVAADENIRELVLDLVLEYDCPHLFVHYITKWIYGDEETYRRVCCSIMERDAIMCLTTLSEHPHFDMVLLEDYHRLLARAGPLTKAWIICSAEWITKGINSLQKICDEDTVYASKEDAVQAVRQACRLSGFQVSLESGSNGNYLKFTCSHGGKGVATKRRSKKCNCPWSISMINSTRKGGYHVTRQNTRHCLHGLDRDMSSFDGLSQLGKNVLAAMRCSHVSPSVVQQISKTVFGSRISIRDVDELAASRQSRDGTAGEMRQRCEREGGLAWDLTSQGNRVAVLMIRAQQRKYLRFADVIFVDATKIPNENDWLTVPITVLDSALEIRCVGTLFMAIATGEIYHWALNRLFQVAEIQANLQTIITDEDTALLSTMNHLKNEFQQLTGRELHDLLCAWHKGKNFQKRWSSLSAEIRDKVSDAWQKLAYTAKIETAEAAKDEIASLLKGTAVERYFSESIVPLIPKFCWAYINALTLGHNTTGVAESSNAKYKRILTTVRYSLWEISDAIIHVDSLADQEQHRRMDLRFSLSIAHTDLLGLQCHGRLQTMLNTSISKALRLVITTNIARDLWQTLDPVFGVTHIVRGLVCTCNKTAKVGLPCSHLIAVCAAQFLENPELEPFPYRLISPRFDVIRKPVDVGKVRELFTMTKEVTVSPILEAQSQGIRLERLEESHRYRAHHFMHAIIDPVIAQASSNVDYARQVTSLLQNVRDMAFQKVEDLNVAGKGKPKLKRIRSVWETRSAPN